MPCSHCKHCREKADAAIAKKIADHEECRRILKAVAKVYRVNPRSLIGHSRILHLAMARQIAFYLARERTTLSFPELGRFFNHDHTTVLHGYKRIKERMGQQPAFAKQVDSVGLNEAREQQERGA